MEKAAYPMKKLTALLLCLYLMIPVLPARAEGAPAWASPSYQALADRVRLPLSPSGDMTRGSFTELLTLLLESAFPQEELKEYPQVAEDYFSDTSYSAYRRAASYGILEGSIGADGLRLLSPGDDLTREQCAKMVCSLLDFVSQKLGRSLEPSGSPASYRDAGSISAWALPYTKQIASYGLMKGDEGGNFDPRGKLNWPSAVVLAHRTLELLDAAAAQSFSGLVLQGKADWSGASRFGAFDNQVAKPMTGWTKGYYTIDNGDGTVSGLTVGSDSITAERFNADGSLSSSKSIEKELPTFGAFLDSGSHFYLAFGQDNDKEEDSREVWRIVQYDRDWNRLGAASVNGGDSYTTAPFTAAVSRMAVSGDGKTLALHAARQRYTTPDDGLRHQSNITIAVNTANMEVLSVSEPFPGNHVSHSFGQFVRFDREEMVTVDHGDAYPRAFVLHDNAQAAELLKIHGNVGDNVTQAIGSGLAVSEDGYLFLGCSDPQDGTGGPWNVFLTYTTKEPKEPTPPWPEGSTETSLTVLPGGRQYEASWKDPDGRTSRWGTFNIEEDLSTTTLTWLTHSETTIDRARLVKVDEDTFVAMWQEGADIHYWKLDGRGQTVGQEQVLSNTPMPPTDPVVMEGDICWIQASSLPQGKDKPTLYRISLP